jgi:virginiamycin B lyase
MRTVCRIGAACVGALAIAIAPASVSAQAPGSFRWVGVRSEFAFGTHGANAIAPGPDGNLWFTGDFDLGRLTFGAPWAETLSLKITAPLSGGKQGNPADLASGPDGDVWLVFAAAPGQPGSVIWRVTPALQVTSFQLPQFSDITSIAAGPDGHMWLTSASGAIVQITTGGAQGFTNGLNPESAPTDIAPGPDGEMWFTDQGHTPAIGRVTPSGEIAEFTSGLPSGSRPRAITAGPDGNVWFTDEGATNAIGRVTPAGTITEFPLPGREPGSWRETHGIPQDPDIVAGADGNLWFLTEDPYQHVGRITPAGQLSEFPVDGLYFAHGLAPGADGNVWMTAEDPGGSFLAAIGTGAAPAVLAPATISAPARPGAAESCTAGTWASWAGRTPSASLYGFDGFHWLRDGVPIAGANAATYVPTAADGGHALSCEQLATYPLPFLVTAASVSAAETIPLPPGTTPLRAAPVITHLRQAHARWRDARTHRRRHRAPFGTRFTFTLNTNASVTLKFARHFTRGRCPSRRRARCEHRVAAGALSLAGHAGANAVRFFGRIGHARALPSGLYSVTVAASNVSGTAAPRTLYFRIVH